MYEYEADYDYGYYESSNSADSVNTSSGIGGIFTGFTDAAAEKWNQMTGLFNSAPGNTQSAIGSSIFQAIYEWGAGKVDLAKTKAATALLASRSPQYYATQNQVGLGLIAVIIIALLAFLFLRKR